MTLNPHVSHGVCIALSRKWTSLTISYTRLFKSLHVSAVVFTTKKNALMINERNENLHLYNKTDVIMSFSAYALSVMSNNEKKNIMWCAKRECRTITSDLSLRLLFLKRNYERKIKDIHNYT